MKKIVLSVGLAVLLSACDPRADKQVGALAHDVCSSLKEMSKQIYIARQKGASQADLMRTLQQQPKTGVMNETIEMTQSVIQDVFKYPKVPEQQWQQQANPFADEHYQRCLKRF